MKKLQVIGLVAVMGLLQSCAVNHYRVYDSEGKTTVDLHQIVWFQKAAAKGMRVSPKTGLTINGIETETQEEVLAKVVESAVKGAVKGAVPIP